MKNKITDKTSHKIVKKIKLITLSSLFTGLAVVSTTALSYNDAALEKTPAVEQSIVLKTDHDHDSESEEVHDESGHEAHGDTHENHDDSGHEAHDGAHESHDEHGAEGEEHDSAFVFGFHFPGGVDIGMMLGFLGLYLFIFFSSLLISASISFLKFCTSSKLNN